MQTIGRLLDSLLEGVGIAVHMGIDHVDQRGCVKLESTRMDRPFAIQTLDMTPNSFLGNAGAPAIIAALTVQMILVRLASMRHANRDHNGWRPIHCCFPSRTPDRWRASNRPTPSGECSPL